MSAPEGLVERETELALVEAALHHLGAGRAAVLAIEGEAGIGKTRLVLSMLGEARSRGAAALGLSRRSPDEAAGGDRDAALGLALFDCDLASKHAPGGEMRSLTSSGRGGGFRTR